MSVQLLTADPHVSTPDARVFDSAALPADSGVLARFLDGVRDADLAAAPVVLPDFHHKSNMEMPSSIAVATRETIRPTLTSASVNCGMALIALDIERPAAHAVADFYQRVRARYPYPPDHRLELSARDVVECAIEGARFAVDRYGVDAAELDRIEERGRLALDAFGGGARLRRELPWLITQLSRLRFGTIGPSNHFVELQEVEEIIDPGAAELLGIRLGQVTLQYHAGGGALAGQLGALFGRRKHSSLPLRAVMAIEKPRYHLASARSIEELRRRLALYFAAGCPPIERHSAEGERYMAANAAAMNYGFAFRLTTYASLRRMAVDAFGLMRSRLVVDSPHNSIYEEDVEGEAALVHRHNACRAYPASMMPAGTVFAQTGQAVLLPGTHRTSSYLCVATGGASRSLYSACHGAGSTVADFAARGVSHLDPGRRVTTRFAYSHPEPELVPQLDDRGVEEALHVLVANDLVKPVARMRPFGVLN